MTDNKLYSRARELKKQITDPWAVLKFLGVDAIPQKGGKPKHQCPWCGGLCSLFSHEKAKILIDYCADCNAQAQAKEPKEQYRGHDLIDLIRQVKTCTFQEAVELAEKILADLGAGLEPSAASDGDEDDCVGVISLDPRKTEEEWRYLLSIGANPEHFRASKLVEVLNRTQRQPPWARYSPTSTWVEMGFSLIVEVLSLSGDSNDVIALSAESRVSHPLGQQKDWVYSNGLEVSAGKTLYVALSLLDALAASDIQAPLRAWDLIRHVDIPDLHGRENGHRMRRARTVSNMLTSVERIAADFEHVVLLSHRSIGAEPEYDYNAKIRELLSRLSDAE
jgi:hypothetical protein